LHVRKGDEGSVRKVMDLLCFQRPETMMPWSQGIKPLHLKPLHRVILHILYEPLLVK
jgi:hypothetical protein